MTNTQTAAPGVAAEELREILTYDPETGVFHWRFDRWRSRAGRAGTVAGSPNKLGYVQIKIGGRTYLAHRLAWLYVKGKLPAESLDHINGNTGDNRIANLREATYRENGANHKPLSTNTSGFRGVSWNPKSRKWVAAARHDGRARYLGCFATPQEAASAYDAFVIANRGEFARPNFLTAKQEGATQ